jgi:hypothetical protein
MVRWRDRSRCKTFPTVQRDGSAGVYLVETVATESFESMHDNILMIQRCSVAD